MQCDLPVNQDRQVHSIEPQPHQIVVVAVVALVEPVVGLVAAVVVVVLAAPVEPVEPVAALVANLSIDSMPLVVVTIVAMKIVAETVMI